MYFDIEIFDGTHIIPCMNTLTELSHSTGKSQINTQVSTVFPPIIININWLTNIMVHFCYLFMLFILLWI